MEGKGREGGRSVLGRRKSEFESLELKLQGRVCQANWLQNALAPCACVWCEMRLERKAKPRTSGPSKPAFFILRQQTTTEVF